MISVYTFVRPNGRHFVWSISILRNSPDLLNSWKYSYCTDSIWNQEACLPRWQSCQKAEPRFEPRSNWFWRGQWQPTLVLLPGKFHGWRSLVGCSPWGHEESDTTEQLHFNFSLSCTGEGNGNPLQCSCLENPRDRGAWWAAVCGIAQSQTRLKRLSSSKLVLALKPRSLSGITVGCQDFSG